MATTVAQTSSSSKQVVIKHFDPMSVARIVAAIYGLLGLIIGGIYGIFIFFFGIALGFSGNQPVLGIIGGLFGGLILGALIVVFYIVIGLVAGLLSSVLYNFAAKKFGGIKAEIE